MRSRALIAGICSASLIAGLAVFGAVNMQAKIGSTAMLTPDVVSAASGGSSGSIDGGGGIGFNDPDPDFDDLDDLENITLNTWRGVWVSPTYKVRPGDKVLSAGVKLGMRGMAARGKNMNFDEYLSYVQEQGSSKGVAGFTKVIDFMKVKDSRTIVFNYTDGSSQEITYKLYKPIVVELADGTKDGRFIFKAESSAGPLTYLELERPVADAHSLYPTVINMQFRELDPQNESFFEEQNTEYHKVAFASYPTTAVKRANFVSKYAGIAPYKKASQIKATAKGL